MGEKLIYKCIYRRMIKWGKNSYINVYIEEWLNGEKIIYKCIYRRMIKWGKNSYINVYIEEWLNGGKNHI